ncbi:MAG: UDP-N-acetylmuramoyl-L-alanine--D-glutamate ligase [Verrucomicrobia bacterium]|nr:UDP-N-acetylmuramoyl-L-alanine--D-glutamate ligase [Verrucomicrobiota bacterium]MBU4291223.1 UDP-N-acetylmuramoyl-L-alanine--D-glutamate ligase [Verrucomicrobiota bacterium]MBU4428805.1 UDP-N-acetylmuramoyl-L-alanine--D-glutamate ligase [Verrucomicrobiota bacterium]MCG2680950.1 UDP-N-acetylmuramoyl-L-alanine--D-glutamate ligase [Kiritimatiellia bacterium]
MQTYTTALVLGLAASGEAAARLLLAEGTKVRIVDRADGDVLRRRAAALESLGAEVALGQSNLPPGLFSVCVVSPGIPANSSWVSGMQHRGVPVLSELELGWSRAACRILAISGSNGKSTLVKLCADALTGAGRRVAVAGNYGIPVSQVVMERRDWDWLVVEVSSFQLETVRAFRPDVAVLLNLYPNHLDRHGDMAAYERLKALLFSRMRSEDVGVVPEALAAKIACLAASPNRWVTFGTSADADMRYHEGNVIDRVRSRSVSLESTAFSNEILGVAGAAAAAAIGACGESLETLGRAARAFRPLPHRMQEVAVRGSIRFVDDSKATNLAAMMAALKMSPGPIRLIAGGLPKHESYEAARSLLAEKVAAVYLIGAAAEIMAAAWQDVVPCRLSQTLENAVRLAWLQSQPGDTVLLSPACASFDQFQSFEDRGNRFAQRVRSLGEMAAR